MFMDEKSVQRIRDRYPVGSRIVLDYMGDDPRPILPGTKGTVRIVDDAGTVHCDFDNGRRLGLIPGEDSFHIELEQKEIKDMEIVLYQINEERDYNECEFMDYNYTQQFGIDPFSYDHVWSGHLEATTLDGVFATLNQDLRPDNYNGRSMSVSDICEVIGADGQSKFYFVDTGASFREVEFDSSLTREAKEREITVLRCQPGKTAEIVKIPNTLKSLQSEVGGYIEAVYPSSDPIALIVNEEGKINGLPLNRALYTEDGQMYDIAAGTMLVVGLTEDDFGSLRGDLLEKYTEKFQHPERFMQFGDQIMAFKIPERQRKEDQTQNHHIRR